MKTKMIISTAAFAALVGAPAFAQSNGSSEPPPVITGSRSLAAVPVVPTGFALQVGGGVTAFSRQAARDSFGTGGYWDARAVLGSRSFLGAELAYVGSARDVKASGFSKDATLLGNGAEAVARANLPLQAGDVRLTPFLFGGGGWTYYQVARGGVNNSGIKDHANAFVIPFGGGMTAAYEHAFVDARFTYRAVFDDKLVPTGTPGNTDHLDLQNWSAGLTLGYEL
jgi:hypothetical protein